MSDPVDFKLTDEEKNSALWRRIEAEMNDRLDKLRKANDNVRNTEQETAILRGHIQRVKACLEWAKPSPNIPLTLPMDGG